MATVTAGYTWTSGETVTPTKLNSTAAPTVVVADNEVTTAKILDANVTNAKLASDIDASKLTTGTLPIARIADAAVTPAKLSQPLTLATAQSTTSGTSIDFTGIPSWVKRITVMLNGVSTSGTSNVLFQLGDSGGFESTGYNSTSLSAATTVLTSNSTAGFLLFANVATDARSGVLLLTQISGNTWIASGTFKVSTVTNCFVAGDKTLSDALTQIRLTTVNGTDTFDAGSVNIMYEG